MGNRPYVWVGHEETHAYDDIIELPHPVSETHPHMSMLDRAAQFSPFDALTGYSDAIDETARPTDARRELSEQELQELDERITLLEEDCRAAARGRFAGDEARRPLRTRSCTGRVERAAARISHAAAASSASTARRVR